MRGDYQFFTPEADAVILAGKQEGKTWAEIAVEVNEKESMSSKMNATKVRRRYHRLSAKSKNKKRRTTERITSDKTDRKIAQLWAAGGQAPEIAKELSRKGQTITAKQIYSRVYRLRKLGKIDSTLRTSGNKPKGEKKLTRGRKLLEMALPTGNMEKVTVSLSPEQLARLVERLL